MKITYMTASNFQPAAYNPRQMQDAKLDELAASIVEYGFVEPVVVNDRTGNVVGGHQRLRALPLATEKVMRGLAQRDLSDVRRFMLESRLSELQEVPVVRLDLSDAQEKSLNVALNKISGEWDMTKLAAVMACIASESLPTGFSAEEIDELLARYEQDIKAEPLTDPDEVPEIDPVSVITQRGNLWQLGCHRLYCGDSTVQSDIDQLIQGQLADMVFTDPPYLMNYQGAMGKGGIKKQRHKVITNDNLSKADGDEFLKKICRSIKTNCRGAWYISFYRLGVDRLYQALATEGLIWRNLIIWAKEHFTLSNSDYKSQYEPIIVGWGDDYIPIFYGWNSVHDFQGSKGERDIWEIELPSIWRIARTKINDLHPTIKPVELCERAIRNSSKVGGVILDLFGGSGSTLIAAEKSGRNCYVMELEPHYCDVIVKRWEDYTGLKAELIN